MIRILIILVNLVSFLFIEMLNNDDVSVSMDAPVIVDAGEEFRIKITISKDDLTSFSRFQQILPAGLTATSENPANADFTFDNKRVRLIWLRMPSSDQITAVYRVKVDERLKGTFSIGGKFSYVANNERKSTQITPQSITIIPSPNIDPSLIVDINDFEKKIIPDLSGPESGQITCIRQTPYLNASGEVVVNLLVHKKDLEKFAKVEEEISDGFSAVSITSKDAIFTFNDNIAKYLWMNLPADPYFIITYNLVPDTDKTLADLSIHGQFSYIREDETIVIDIIQKDIDLNEISSAEIRELIQGKKQGTSPQEPIKDQPIEEKQPDGQEQEIIEPIAQTDQTDIYRNLNETEKKYMLEPESGVYYRVQLAAGHKPVNIPQYFRQFNLDPTRVKKERHEGWIKYSVGSFGIYKEARDYRVHIWNTTEIDDAFVSAYNNGARITVQEALMIANQQWYR
ncbi:MAG: hypothetical protein GVY19_10760 [Bacteroidetes bacterium]|jgi:hypothetical protein|nr:hypothetical protein [Bacteroidota bacterium]